MEDRVAYLIQFKCSKITNDIGAGHANVISEYKYLGNKKDDIFCYVIRNYAEYGEVAESTVLKYYYTPEQAEKDYREFINRIIKHIDRYKLESLTHKNYSNSELEKAVLMDAFDIISVSIVEMRESEIKLLV